MSDEPRLTELHVWTRGSLVRRPALGTARDWARDVRQKTYALSDGRSIPVSSRAGHVGVTSGLVMGLRYLGVPYRLNHFRVSRSATIYAIASVSALVEAAARRSSGRPGLVVSGPNNFVLPREVSITALDAVDLFLVPSPWVEELYLRDAPSLGGRLKCWPAGIDFEFWSRPPPKNPRDAVVIYIKTSDPRPLGAIRRVVSRLGINTIVLHYGRHSATKYRSALVRAYATIYAGSSESQGLAQLESWAMDCPTFVYSPESARLDISAQESVHLARSQFSPAPYLNSIRGALWETEGDLGVLLEDCVRERVGYRPRSDTVVDFTYQRRTEALCELIRDLKGR